MRKSEKTLMNIIILLIIVILVILIKIVPTVYVGTKSIEIGIVPNSSKLGIPFLFYASFLDIFIIALKMVY